MGRRCLYLGAHGQGRAPGEAPWAPPGQGTAGGEGVALGEVPAPRCVWSPFTGAITADMAEREQIALRLELQIAFLTLQGFPNLDICAVYTYITVVYGDYQRGQSCLWVVLPKRSSWWLCSGVPGDSGWASSRYSFVLGAGSVCSLRLFTRGPPAGIQLCADKLGATSQEVLRVPIFLRGLSNGTR